MEEKNQLTINWFPGHMTTALRVMKEELKNIDAVIYMLDARCPVSCLNPKFGEIFGNKPILYILNKSDLAGMGIKQFFINHPRAKKLLSQGNNAVAVVNSAQSGAGKLVVGNLIKLLSEKISSAKARGINKILRVCVIGVPNSGKSTLINNLSGKAKTVTADKPGVTRQKQWVAVNDHIWLMDTPGTLWPAFDNQQVAKNLAYVGSIRDEVVNLVDLSKALMADLEKLQSGCIEARFGAGDFLEICKKRGYILKGGLLDEGRAAKAIVWEFRAGKLGKFNLDTLDGDL